MRRLLGTAAALLIAGLVALPVRAMAQGGAVALTGSIANGTAGAGVPEGLMVTATEVDAGATKQVATKRVAAGPGGSFRVEGLPGQSGDRFVVGTDYLGVTYSADAQPASVGGTPTTLKVYETTIDDSVLSIGSETMTVLIGKQANYNVLQDLAVHNSSDRTYTGTPNPAVAGSRPTVELPIPSGATAFAPVQGLISPLTAAPDGLVASTDPVLPGNTDLSYLFNVAVPRSGWGMSRPVIYPTGRVEILVDPGLTLSGPGLSFRKSVTIGSKTYRNYEAGAVAAGSTLQADIKPVSSNGPGLWLGLGALGVVALVAAVGVPRLIRRRRTAADAADGPAPGERDRLIEEIAALDEAHEAGDMPEKEYATARARLKDRLVALSTHAPGSP